MSLLSPAWELPPEELACTTRAIHLWLARLDVVESLRRYFGDMLSPDEHRRAEKFTFDQHRARFIAGRGFLRSILGKYVQTEPAKIMFRYNPWGKPTLDPRMKQDALHFNMSHSNGVALFAFTGAGAIGVDIEYIRLQTDIEQTGAIVFSETELSVLQSIAPELRRTAFFQYWTRKEAFMKAVGEGFSVPLREFDVSLAPEKPVANIGNRNEQSPYADWYVQDITLIEGYAAALACKSNRWPVSFFSIPDAHFL